MKRHGFKIAAKKIWSRSRSVVLVLICLYVTVLVILLLFQSQLIYFPQREITATPGDIGLSYQAVYFTARDGVKLSGWFVPAPRSRGVVLFCHGNAGNISHRLESIRVFHHLGLGTFIFDYRGYGESEGKPTEEGTYLDAEAAWGYLVQEQGVTSTEIVIFGRSLGGAIAAWLAQNHTPKALIIESTFTSVRDIASELYPYLPVRLISGFDYDARAYLRQVSCPVLIVHSRDDEMISFDHGRRLFEIANEPKELLEITGSHNEGFMVSAKGYRDGLDSFISRYVGR